MMGVDTGTLWGDSPGDLPVVRAQPCVWTVSRSTDVVVSLFSAV